MKTFISILILGVVTAAFIGGMFYGRFVPAKPSPQQLTLEQIVHIKELHLVRHTYTDLFYLHKQNNKDKPIRAIIEVPVEITAYLNLRAIRVITRGDSITQLVLPNAVLHQPSYNIERMLVRETRSFQVHAGRDLYPHVSQYVQAVLQERLQVVTTAALQRNILVQAEAEAKEYIEMCLRSIGRTDIRITFEDEQTNKAVVQFAKELQLNATLLKKL